ncbi:hypothetical protein Ancab_024414 [Ancistrocladus abbreviatus]
MASPLSSLLLTLVVVCAFAAPMFCTILNSSVARDRKNNKVGFRTTLEHVDSSKNLTRFERAKHAIERGNRRIKRFKVMITGNSNIATPVSPGNGEYLMALEIGTPAISYSAIMDTGSDLIWTQCSPCLLCYSQPTPIFDPKKSSSFKKLPCLSELCLALGPQEICLFDCLYTYEYGDSSSTSGYMASETFTFKNAGSHVFVPNIAFGCGLINLGQGFQQGGGLVGMGRGPLSLPSQTDDPKFSYCLTSQDSSEDSILLFGSAAENMPNGKTTTISLANSPFQPSFYTIEPIGMSVDGYQVPIPLNAFGVNFNGTGGMIVDSGTTLLILIEAAYDPVTSSLDQRIQLPKVDPFFNLGLEYCYEMPSSMSSDQLPKLAIHFNGSDDLELYWENYIIQVSDVVGCLAMASSSQLSILGNIAQQNYYVLFTPSTVTFVQAKCEGL